MDKVSKPSVHYRQADPKAKRRCGTCSMFKPHVLYKGHTGTCTLVLGSIHKDDTCDEWERK